MAAFEDVDIVVLDAPTGSGKTLIAELVRRCLETRGLYVCTTKTLQDQVVRDFPYAKVLKGRANYPTVRFPEVSCDDCSWSQESACPLCPTKHECPYEMAKSACLKAELGIVNTSYLLTEANHVGKFSGLEFVIADEADTLERELMGFVSVEISKFRAARYKLQPPKKVTVASSWGEWIDETIPVLQSRRPKIRQDSDAKIVRERQYLDRLLSKLRVVRDGLSDGYWVYTGRADGDISFRPSRVDALGMAYLWGHAKKWLLMSATVVSDEELVSSLGLDREHRLVRVGSTFDKENRKVIVQPAADMSRARNEREKMVDAVSSVLARHPDDRVLVHTVSYDLTEYLVRNVANVGDRTFLSYREGSERADRLAKFADTERSVLFAPSMDRGVDLTDELCRVQIIAKVPFPYLGDRQ